MINPERERNSLAEFLKKKVLNISELKELLQCSIPTVRNRLRAWRVYTSFNQNGRYYTLPRIPVFDEYGLWWYKQIGFSKHGNLKQTLIKIVRDSAVGLDASQIGRLLRLAPRSFLSHFRAVAGLHRESQRGRFIYFSDEPSILLKQKSRREQAAKRARAEIPSDAAAVAVFADLVKHPDSTLADCSKRLKRKGVAIAPGAIGNLLDRHGIKKNRI